MTTATPAAATGEAFGLAEGPVWDAVRQRLLWVDIHAGQVLEGALGPTGRISVTRRHQFDSTVGAVAVAEDGTLLVAAQEHLVVVAADGTRYDGPRIVGAGERRRLNDGSIDPTGRFLVGTLGLDGDSRRETLVRLEPDGEVTTLDSDLTLSNGLAWTADGRTLYSVDTLRRTVHVRDYTRVGTERRTHLRLADGYPDGIAMDAEEHLWVAVWGKGEIRRYAPDGTIAARCRVPAPHTSSVAFAGPDLRTLVITTATSELTGEQRRQHPDSGRLFTVRVDVPGIPVPAWLGCPSLLPC
ncbi:SMP-30/gluconolactonase/LRE family protein [Streptomyces sp. NPDC050255]|uniref:SMP-30/gluconolactonase/LRE family protein n=1 Tax=Streptomyces sp. NPDC050255 TaxID=3365606 RepID=UPI0037883948